MGRTKMAHYLHFEKRIRAPDPFVQIWQSSENILLNHDFHEFPLSPAQGYFPESLKTSILPRIQFQVSQIFFTLA